MLVIVQQVTVQFEITPKGIDSEIWIHENVNNAIMLVYK